MTTVLPLRFRRISETGLIFADESGQFFRANQAFLDRFDNNAPSETDLAFLRQMAMSYEHTDNLNETAFLHRLAGRLAEPSALSYVILVPTLRCNLSCSYCQVSRAAMHAKGYDWSDETLEAVLSYLGTVAGPNLQVEFQGGEPTLRPDLLLKVMSFCREKFDKPRFIVCTNLSVLNPDILDLISHDDVHVSTSLDGPRTIHQAQRTENLKQTDTFFSHFERVQELIGSRLSALPTLNTANLPEPSAFLDAFAAYDMRNIYLRPVVYHGFARKKHPQSRHYHRKWEAFYEACIQEMIKRNAEQSSDVFQEFYLTLALKRLLRPGEDNHIDLRSPNWLGFDHQLIDYDGKIYPSDEARMLARTGQVDLSMGSVKSGVNHNQRINLQGSAFNALDPWCEQCVYQAACGSDPIDDLARHGRADVPKPLSAYCQKHLHIFDFAMSLIYSEDPKIQKSLALWLDLPASTPLGYSAP